MLGGLGLIFGPIIGGILVDLWNLESPFIITASISLVIFVLSLIGIPYNPTK